MRKHKLGIYEKALPKSLSWEERLASAKACGFDFVEISIDEDDLRLARLDWSKEERVEVVMAQIKTGVNIPSMCLSAHRRFPFGSHDNSIKQKAYEIMEKAIKLAIDIGVHTIQLAGYDVYYEESDSQTQKDFLEGLKWATDLAASNQIMLAVEIMDTKYMSSITRWKYFDEAIKSPWFCVYPDIGNLSAWNDDIYSEIDLGLDKIVAFHLKDTYKVTKECKGQFRDVVFGEGCVDFESFFKYLVKIKYRGAFMIEMWSEKSEDPLFEVIKAKRWLEEKMEKGGLIC
ncbi:MAG: L-ribulose-5-phosphate 3-epimerase [Psittacicella sp.]